MSADFTTVTANCVNIEHSTSWQESSGNSLVLGTLLEISLLAVWTWCLEWITLDAKCWAATFAHPNISIIGGQWRLEVHSCNTENNKTHTE